MTEKPSVLDTFKNSDYLEYDINTARYKWSVRLFRLVRAALKVNLSLHDDNQNIHHGQIFVINHFSRFETFIPQYLIYEETGAFCCSITHSEFFKGDDAFARYLLEVGGIPHDYRQLLPLLATQVLRGRKVIIFPEGGMVKDRRVVNSDDGYKIYSRTRKQWRKQHTGAAVLGICLDLFKQAISYQFESKNYESIDHWVKQLRFESAGQLQETIQQPTLIVPVNITFYPIRVNENFLLKGARLLNPGIKHRHLEELLVESNIILRETDMDINVGDSINVASFWKSEQCELQQSILPLIKSIDQVFNFKNSEKLPEQKTSKYIRQISHQIRDQYAHQMYRLVTVNMSHLASVLIMKCVEQTLPSIDHLLFCKTLYLALKQLQLQSTVLLHESLRNPNVYCRLLTQSPPGLQRFINMAVDNNLVRITDDEYIFLPKLNQEFGVDEIRMENLIAVYANEVAVIDEVNNAIDKAYDTATHIAGHELALIRFEDEIKQFHWDKEHSPKSEYESIDEINNKKLNNDIPETATEDPSPFLLFPSDNNNCHSGVLLIHGLLASPAELRPFAEYLVKTGFTVLGVRLKGHGTTPLELASLHWQDWYQSVVCGHEILTRLVDDVHLVGFSTGGALGMLLAAVQHAKIKSIAAVCVPVKFVNPNMMMISLLHGVNRFTQLVATTDVIKAFVLTDTEHPHINYRHVPVKALYELRQLIDELENKISEIKCPVMLLQAKNDPVVDSSSALRLYERLVTDDATLVMLPATKHGILYQNTEHIWERLRCYFSITKDGRLGLETRVDSDECHD